MKIRIKNSFLVEKHMGRLLGTMPSHELCDSKCLSYDVIRALFSFQKCRMLSLLLLIIINLVSIKHNIVILLTIIIIIIIISNN